MAEKRSKVDGRKGFEVVRDEERAALARSSLRAFVELYLPHHIPIKPPPYHEELYRFFDTVANPKRPLRLLDIEPRGYGKSMRWGFFLPLWLLVCRPYGIPERVVIISNTATLAERNLSWISRELKYNALLRADWGPIIDDAEKDRNDLIQLANPQVDEFIKAIGSGAQVRGFHPTQVIIDDLEDREDAKSPELRSKMEEYLWADVVGGLEDYSALALIGTVVNEQAILPTFYKNPGKVFSTWIKRHYDVLIDGKTPLWPEKQDKEALDRERAEYEEAGKLAIWYQEKRNIPMPMSSKAIRPQWIKYVDKVPHNTRDMYKVTFMDPAFGTKRSNDYSAIVTAGVVTHGESKGDIYVLERERGRWSSEDKATAYLDHLDRWRPDKYGVESAAEATDFVALLKRKALDRNRYCRPTVISPRGVDKVARAESVSPLFEGGYVHLLTGQEDLAEELLTIPYGAHDDMADALIYALRIIDQGWRRRARQMEIPTYTPPAYLEKTGGY